MNGVVALLVVIVAVVVLVGHHDAIQQRRQALARALGGVVTSEGIGVRWNGVDVWLHFRTTGGKHRKTWTYVEAALPPHYPFALYLRGHGYEDNLQIQRGVLVDVEVGDPAFDATYVVEGAPAEVVRRVLTPSVRAVLMARPPLKLDTVNGVLQLVMEGWHEEPAQARVWVELFAALVSGVRAATMDADAAIAHAPAIDPYRGIPDDQPLELARAARFDEVARLGSMRQARDAESTMGVVIVVVVVLVIGALAMASSR